MKIKLFSHFARFISIVFMTSACALPCANAAQSTILVVGDSISAAYGLSPAQGWVAQAGNRLKAQAPQWTIQNASLSGETSAGGAQRLPALLKTHQPKLLIIELGGNDALRGLPIKQTEQNFIKMIQAAKASKAQVLLVPMQIPPNYGPTYAKAFNGLYAKLAQSHKVALSEFIFKGFAEDLNYFQRDRIHPTAAAQGMMLDTLWPAIARSMK